MQLHHALQTKVVKKHKIMSKSDEPQLHIKINIKIVLKIEIVNSMLVISEY